MYILIEMQTDNGSTSILPPVTYTDRNQADSAYYTRLASATVSSVDVHSVMMFNEHGEIIQSIYYEHK